jgi:DNA-directed RNA polymerase specialized sigma24 family protein
VSQDPVDNIDKNLKKEQVAKCIDKLPLHYKAPLALYYMEDKTYEEIMDILRLPRGTVAARINRAKKQMRNLCQKIYKKKSSKISNQARSRCDQNGSFSWDLSSQVLA